MPEDGEYFVLKRCGVSKCLHDRGATAVTPALRSRRAFLHLLGPAPSKLILNTRTFINAPDLKLCVTKISEGFEVPRELES